MSNVTNNVANLLFGQQVASGPGLCSRNRERAREKRKLEQWQEGDSLKQCKADYASFSPAPRSTIALCYNCNGELLASTHGDHTVKITDCLTGKLVRVLSGHRRTPWVVRFHPSKPQLVASGSLDHEVRLWDANTGECLARHTFGKPIASLAFHISTDVLAIACGHKLYMWEHTSGKGPVIVLKTRRSMRAVHFHPHGLPFVLTAEVQDPSATPELPQTLTEAGPFVYNKDDDSSNIAAAVHVQDSRHNLTASASDHGGLDNTNDMQPTTSAAAGPVRKFNRRRPQRWQHNAEGLRASLDDWIWQHAVDTAGAAGGSNPTASIPRASSIPRDMEATTRSMSAPVVGMPTSSVAVPSSINNPQVTYPMPSAAAASTSSAHGYAVDHIEGLRFDGVAAAAAAAAAAITSVNMNVGQQLAAPPSQPIHLPPSMVPVGYELPFPGLRIPNALPYTGGLEALADQQAGGVWNPQLMAAAFSAAAWNILGEEQPPRVRLRLWSFDSSKPVKQLDVNTDIRLQLSDAVLCSEMGVHFSPCGRYLAATVACKSLLPVEPGVPAPWHIGVPRQSAQQGHVSSEDGPESRATPLPYHSVPGSAVPLGNPVDASTAPGEGVPYPPGLLGSVPGSAWMRYPGQGTALGAVAPTGHNNPGYTQGRPSEEQASTAMVSDVLEPAQGGSAVEEGLPAQMSELLGSARAERVTFEVRVYSIDGTSFGEVVRAKRIRAAHCLTSVQFSPTSDHMLLAYGKKHVTLLRSLVPERGTMVAMHTILEVFRLSDMELVRVLPSADDEINAACFHPIPGGGMAYGTKEGKLRIISHDRSIMQHDDVLGTGDNGDGNSVLDGPGAAVPMDIVQPAGLNDNFNDLMFLQTWLRQPGNAAAALVGAAMGPPAAPAPPPTSGPINQ